LSEKKRISRRNLLALLGTAAGAALTAGASSAAFSRRSGRNENAGSSVVHLTFQDMRADESLTEGMTVRTLGYYEPGDGGGGEYIVKADQSRADGGSVTNLKNGLQGHLLPGDSINYKMFGAVGDGKNDDGEQIKAAHTYANRMGLPVVNLSGEYWIKQTNSILITTNVHWGHTKFYIDEQYNTKGNPRFQVISRKAQIPISLDAEKKKSLLARLKPGTTLIPELAEYKNCLIVVADNNDRIGFRAGEKYDGQSWAREELFYVEEHGRIIGDIAWTFKDYTSLIAYPCDDNYLIIDGGTFYMTGDSPGKNYEGYWHNGFNIRRSRTIIRNQWVGLANGKADVALDPRHGFYTFNYVYDVLLENVRLIPWEQNRDGTDRDVPAGTYGIGGNRILNATFRNVTAEGSQVHWGVFGTNLNKNFRVENCKLNRIDVHFHCWNLYVRDSEIGRYGLTVTGGGNLFVDNTTVMGNNFINFRNDFGSKWDGNIRLRNCRLVVLNVNSDATCLLFNPADFNYRYPIVYGRTIRVEDFTFDFTGFPEAKSICRLMKIAAFSKMKHGERVIFPQRAEFENVSVIGREQGIRLMEIRDPFGYALGQKGGYDGQRLVTNCYLRFANIQTETLSPQKPQEIGHAHFMLLAAGERTYEDEYALYPKIDLVNLGSFFGHFQSAAADVYFQDCTIRGLNAFDQTPMRGRLTFDRCRFQADVGDNGNPFYRLETALGTSFVNCTVDAPIVDGALRPDLVGRYGFIDINQSLKFSHLNTRLSQELIKEWSQAAKRLEPEFVEMLKSHHELEPEAMLRRKGTSAQRPNAKLLGTQTGFSYFDTGLGQLIVWDGSRWHPAAQAEETLHFFALGSELADAGEVPMKRMERHPTQDYAMRANGTIQAYASYAAPSLENGIQFDLYKNGAPWQSGLTLKGGQSRVPLSNFPAFSAGDRISVRLHSPGGAYGEHEGITIDLFVRYSMV
jgi:hypothetical protein